MIIGMTSIWIITSAARARCWHLEWTTDGWKWVDPIA
jgi:hypothetical protein